MQAGVSLPAGPEAAAALPLIRQRYKVVGAKCALPDYALLEAVDIAERETPLRFLNCYEGEQLRRYGRIFSALRPEDCPAYRGMFLEGETLVAVFDACRGESVDLLFHRGDRWSWRERLEWAERVLHQALLLSPLPPEVACAALLSENLLADEAAGAVRSRFLVLPMEDMNRREIALLAADQVLKILPPTLRSTPAEAAFLETLRQGAYDGVVPLYAAWRAAMPEICREREEYEALGPFRRGWTLLRRWFRRRSGRPDWS